MYASGARTIPVITKTCLVLRIQCRRSNKSATSALPGAAPGTLVRVFAARLSAVGVRIPPTPLGFGFVSFRTDKWRAAKTWPQHGVSNALTGKKYCRQTITKRFENARNRGDNGENKGVGENVALHASRALTGQIRMAVFEPIRD